MVKRCGIAAAPVAGMEPTRRELMEAAPSPEGIERKGHHPMHSLPGLTRMGKFCAEDVFVVGYPKSGNTWFQDLISAVVHGVMPEHCPPRLIQDLVPDVHANEFYKRYSTPMFFKSHHLPRREYRRVVYLLRDGRDVMVSYFHHLSAMPGASIDFLDMVQSGRGMFPCRWPEHVTAWLSNPFRAELLVIRYEDLKKDTANELNRFCQFVGLQREEKFLQKIAEATEFARMQAKEIGMGVGGDPGWPDFQGIKIL